MLVAGGTFTVYVTPQEFKKLLIYKATNKRVG